MKIEEIKDIINWIDTPIMGMSLLLMSGSIDSEGNQIEAIKYYNVGRCKETGKVVIILIDKK